MANRSTKQNEVSILTIRPFDEPSDTWGVFGENAKPILLIQRKWPECEIREYELSHPHARGTLLVTFLGPKAFHDACAWAKSYRFGARSSPVRTDAAPAF